MHFLGFMVQIMENRGGRREGSGRKRASISNQEVAKLIRAAKRKAKETGKSVADILIECIYNERGRIRLAAVKTFYDQVVTAASEAEVRVRKANQPAIYLPESKPDPATIKLVKGANG